MDNLTHTLTGIVLARAGFDRVTPHAAWLLAIASNVPDLDIVSGLFGARAYLEYHRGFTHAAILAPAWAAFAVVITRYALRKPLPWGRAWFAALAAIAVHIMMDSFTGYGTKPWWPFQTEWMQWPIMFVSDAVLMTVLLLALAAPALSRLVSSEIGAARTTGRGWAVFALVFFLAWIGVRGTMRARVETQLASRIYQGRVPKRIQALPTAFNPFRWRGLVECEGFLMEHELNALAEFDPEEGEMHVTPRNQQAVQRAKQTPYLETFLRFAQWPAWRVMPVDEPEGGTRVEVRDLRFPTSFSALVVLDKQGRPVRQELTGAGLRDNSEER